MTRIISADEARALREAATPGPWEWADVDGVHYPVGAVVGRDGAVVVDLGEDPVEPYCGGRAGQDASEADEALIAAAPTLAATVEHLQTELARLRRVIAVECGDATQAPEGWRTMGREWAGPGECYVHRIDHGRWSWVARDAADKVRGRGIAATAYEAMEAADAAMRGAP